jgi:RNA polymerase sigma factor (sigma-70 family)
MTEEWRDLPLRTVLETAGEYAAARRAGAEVAVSGESAWREVMRRIELLAHRLAFPLDADEVTQLVLVRLQEPERIASVLRSNNTTAYLFQLIRNVARELERARNAEARRLVGLAVQARVVPEPGTAESLLDQAGSLKRALARLSPGDRALLKLRFVRGLGTQEIAAHLALPYSTAAVRISRALKRLRDSMAPDDGAGS